MHILDLIVFLVYMLTVVGIGYYFYRKNDNPEDYYVGGRKMGSLHIGLSVVATDVGGGFSIGLGGLGFVMGLSGSWMLFTGLLGAWLSAVFLIPKVRNNKAFSGFFTFPQIVGHFYGAKVALLAGLISAIGYLGFTSSQLLAGAKLAHGAFPMLDQQTALIVMGFVAVVYTVMGGLKAVVYTDTFQWIILMGGLIFIAIPISYSTIGGIEGIRDYVRPEMLSLRHIAWQTFVNWGVTIIPIWFVGMTLYQRIFACKNAKTAQRAWFFAGLLEYPVMAFMGVLLGLFARIAADQGLFVDFGATQMETMDPETGLPMLVRHIMPVGLLGLIIAAYFSAILSTADSCLMASSGNVVTDVMGRFFKKKSYLLTEIRLSQIVTLFIGFAAMVLAMSVSNVIDMMLRSYSFMVAGLFVPVLGAFFFKRVTPPAAISAMIMGGALTLILSFSLFEIGYGRSKDEINRDLTYLKQHFDPMKSIHPDDFSHFELIREINRYKPVVIKKMGIFFLLPLGLDPIVWGILFSLLTFLLVNNWVVRARFQSSHAQEGEFP